MTPAGNHLVFGTTLVATILLFTAFVALFRRDIGDPYVAAAVFTGVGLVIGVAGRIAARVADQHGRRRAAALPSRRLRIDVGKPIPDL